MRFIHTADWQIGKPFARVKDAQKRALIQQARIEAIQRIGSELKKGDAEAVLVAGDLFDSVSADKATVSSVCSAVGLLGVPVLVIPGNHDHAGPGSVWEQDFFRREQTALADNMVLLTEPVPYELEGAVVLPCPLVRRTVAEDTTEWLRAASVLESLPADKARIVLAHGSTQVFSGGQDEEEAAAPTNPIDLSRLDDAEIDYVALGDWHGTKQVSPKAWYSGTPEPDHFAKGADYESGNVLLVETQRGQMPQVTKSHTGRLNWTELNFDLAGDAALEQLESRLDSLLGRRAGEDLLRLTLRGSLGMEAMSRLERICESLEARLLRLKLVDQTRVAPSEEEIQDLTDRGADPVVARVAARLVELGQCDDEKASVAHVALRELYAACTEERGR